MQNAVPASATGADAIAQKGISATARRAASTIPRRRPSFCERVPPVRQPRMAPDVVDDRDARDLVHGETVLDAQEGRIQILCPMTEGRGRRHQGDRVQVAADVPGSASGSAFAGAP
jgi:hypothetical protein